MKLTNRVGLNRVLGLSTTLCLAFSALSMIMLSPVHGQTWNTFRKDIHRSGDVASPTSPVALEPAWEWKAESKPFPAWDGPARWDAYNRVHDLPAMRQYDACFYPVSDGDVAIFGSSSQDFVQAVNLKTGKLVWRYVAGGPVRLAPTIYEDRVLFGCDDGFVYCLQKSDGKLNWKFSPSVEKGAEQRMLINNDRLISYYPIRTGVVAQDGIAYFGASMLPWRESYLSAVDIKTGTVGKAGTFIESHENATLEGNLLIAGERLIVPQGRIAPLLFSRTDGSPLGTLPGGGGVTAVVTEQGDVVRSEGGKPSRGGQMAVFRGKQRVASFPRGRAIVVSKKSYFVIDGQKLFAARRDNNELLWSCDVDEPLEIIKVGDAVIVGGGDHVTGINAVDGKVLWSAEVDGRVFGLACAQNHLLVSTDVGMINAYRLVMGKLEAKGKANAPDLAKNWSSPPVPKVRKKSLLHRWVFHRSAMQSDAADLSETTVENVVVKDQASGMNLSLKGSAVAKRINDSEKLEALSLSGGYFPHEVDLASMPRKAITVAAWVRVDTPQQWGGIAGCIQDDGSTEHGWLLGYKNDAFCMAVAGGGNGLTYLTANNAFASQSWNHVVGTYNGSELRIYVNGALAASSDKEKGEISYSDACFFTVGSYRDANEDYPLKGALQEVRVYSNAISATAVTRLFEEAAGEFNVALGASKQKVAERKPDDRLPNNFLAWGPYTRFVRPGEIEVSYGTQRPQATVVDVIGEGDVKRLQQDVLTQDHTVVIKDLPYKRQLQFQIFAGEAKDAESTEPFLVDTHFDWANERKSKTRDASVSDLIGRAANPRGLVLAIGSEQKEQAKALAQQSDFHVILVEPDEKKAADLRNDWANDPEVTYGRKLNVVQKSMDHLPAAFATIVLSSKNEGTIRRLVRPQGGVLHDGGSVVWQRGGLKGAGAWSHMYGTADNSAFGGEELSNVSERSQLTTQWIGRPGPRYQTDRQNRKPSPLAVGGRLFLQGQQRMIALDNYSGAVLWSVEAPTVMRWNVPHDCSNWCGDDDGVFVAANQQAWFVDGRDGKVARKFEIPVENKQGKHWGYIARHRSSLIGSVVKSSAPYTRWWGASQWFDSTGGADTHVVAGDKLFAMDAATGDLQWQYDGLVLHPTITIMDDRIYFVESQTESHRKGDTRRLSLDAGQQHALVALDAISGEELWRTKLDPFAGHLSSFYLAGGGEGDDRTLILDASEATKSFFQVQSFDPESGQRRWEKKIAWEANHHGKHISRPAIQGDLVYIRPEVLNLKTGKTVHRGFPGGHGCSSYTACTNGIFTRLGDTTWWDARTKKVNRFKRIRTDCWLSVVPAQGMLISAEGGGGCSCGSWLETSMSFLPRNIDQELPEDE